MSNNANRSSSIHGGMGSGKSFSEFLNCDISEVDYIYQRNHGQQQLQGHQQHCLSKRQQELLQQQQQQQLLHNHHHQNVHEDLSDLEQDCCHQKNSSSIRYVKSKDEGLINPYVSISMDEHDRSTFWDDSSFATDPSSMEQGHGNEILGNQVSSTSLAGISSNSTSSHKAAKTVAAPNIENYPYFIGMPSLPSSKPESHFASPEDDCRLVSASDVIGGDGASASYDRVQSKEQHHHRRQPNQQQQQQQQNRLSAQNFNNNNIYQSQHEIGMGGIAPTMMNDNSYLLYGVGQSIIHNNGVDYDDDQYNIDGEAKSRKDFVKLKEVNAAAILDQDERLSAAAQRLHAETAVFQSNLLSGVNNNSISKRKGGMLVVGGVVANDGSSLKKSSKSIFAEVPNEFLETSTKSSSKQQEQQQQQDLLFRQNKLQQQQHIHSGDASNGMFQDDNNGEDSSFNFALANSSQFYEDGSIHGNHALQQSNPHGGYGHPRDFHHPYYAAKYEKNNSAKGASFNHLFDPSADYNNALLYDERTISSKSQRKRTTHGHGASFFQVIGSSAGDPIKSKRQKHVQKACVHCKKAHLACDNERPCRRCVHLGKTDCIDVEHKRRGRPKSNPEKKNVSTIPNMNANGHGRVVSIDGIMNKSSESFNSSGMDMQNPLYNHNHQHHQYHQFYEQNQEKQNNHNLPHQQHHLSQLGNAHRFSNNNGGNQMDDMLVNPIIMSNICNNIPPIFYKE